MSKARVVVSFGGCKTHAEAVARFAAWLDSQTDTQVRAVASQWLVDDGADCDQAAFQDELAQLRAVFSRGRAETLQWFAELLDKEFGPERRPAAQEE